MNAHANAECRDARLFMSTACLGGDKSHRRVLDAFVSQGIMRTELTGVHPYLPDGDLEDLVREYQARGMEFTFHNYFPPPPESIVLNFLARDPARRRRSEALIANAVRLAKRTGVSLYAFHPGYYRNGEADPGGQFVFDPDEPRTSPSDGMARFQQDFIELYRSFGLETPSQSTFVAIENLFPPARGENDSFMCTFEEIDALFSTEQFSNSNVGLLIDLGHLTIASNILGFDRETALRNIVDRYGNRIYEVHLSENDGTEDLHWRITPGSWQLQALDYFRSTGSRCGGTLFCIESRGMTMDDVRRDHDLVRKKLA